MARRKPGVPGGGAGSSRCPRARRAPKPTTGCRLGAGNPTTARALDRRGPAPPNLRHERAQSLLQPRIGKLAARELPLKPRFVSSVHGNCSRCAERGIRPVPIVEQLARSLSAWAVQRSKWRAPNVSARVLQTWLLPYQGWVRARFSRHRSEDSPHGPHRTRILSNRIRQPVQRRHDRDHSTRCCPMKLPCAAPPGQAKRPPPVLVTNWFIMSKRDKRSKILMNPVRGSL